MKRLSDQTLYEILEVPVEAAPEEIAKACERALALYGPGSLATYTLMSPDEATLLTNRIEEARTVLLDPDARARYDERIGVRPRATPVPAATPVPLQGVATPWPSPLPPAITPMPAAAVSSTTTTVAPLEPPARPPLPLQTLAPVTPPEAPAPAPILPEEAPPAAAVAPPDAEAAAPGPAPIPLKQEVSLPKELLVPEGAAWSGEMLRKVREARGLGIAQISERTKVTRHHIENIEAERYAALPAVVYLRGILTSLARELRLDGPRVARSYLERMAQATKDGRG